MSDKQHSPQWRLPGNPRRARPGHRVGPQGDPQKPAQAVAAHPGVRARRESNLVVPAQDVGLVAPATGAASGPGGPHEGSLPRRQEAIHSQRAAG